jgi:hypothetical protein
VAQLSDNADRACARLIHHEWKALVAKQGLNNASTNKPCPVGMGVKLNVNWLVQSGAIEPGAHIECRTTWPNTYGGELTAIMESKIRGTEEGWLKTPR